uniref:BCL3 transcription coactivator n=1 Tax=Vombatus ursinus TaxID=29139 RepID=A0A4X2LGN5_VOMUR
MPRCPRDMDEGPVDLRTRPKAGAPDSEATLPLRKRRYREPQESPGPGIVPAPEPSPQSPSTYPGLPGPATAIYYPGPFLYPAPAPFSVLSLPPPTYPVLCPLENPLTADIAKATRPDEDGDTPLHIAVAQGNLLAVHRLVHLFQQGGRDLDVYNNLRQTPLHLAVITTLPSVVRLLVSKGANPMALDRNGQTAAHLACEHRSSSCLRALLETSAPGVLSLEARNYEGLTPLHVAVNTEDRETVLLLLDRGADIDAVHGANVNAQMYSGSSALHSASGRGLLPLVRTLVRSGADSSLKNCHNDTPLMVARNRRVIDILRGKASRPSPQPTLGPTEPSQEGSTPISPEGSSQFGSSGPPSASPASSSPPRSPPEDPPTSLQGPQIFFLPTQSPTAFLPYTGPLRAPGRPVPPSPAPGGS